MCNGGGGGKGFASPGNIDSLINEQHAGNILSAVEGTASDPRFDAGQDKNGTSPSERSN